MAPDERPVLLCRVHVPTHMQEDVDAWMPKHFDDSLWHPACTAAANYAVRCDWERLPSVWNNDCTRFIPYAAEDVEGLLAWVDAPELRGAIEDGVEREAQYPALDGEPFFNGSILGVVEVRGACGSDFAGRGPILAERFQVGGADVEAFDEWLAGPYLERAGAWPGAVRARTLAAIEGIPQRWPYTRYQGRGNRMLWVDFEDDADIFTIVGSREVGESIADSLRWDARLSYVRRDAAECLLVRTKADLASAPEAGTPG
jgi:hypothetical protein